MTVASEAGHWYTAEGEPAYTIVGKNGAERNVTLRDARTLNLYPSVTTIIKEAAAPGLEAWKQRQVMEAALTTPRMDGDPESEWIKQVFTDSREQAKVAAERGTEIHGAIEHHYQTGPYRFPLESLQPHVDATVECVNKMISRAATWSAEKSFAHPAGYGGKVDLHSKDCSGMVVDFKTKDGEKPEDIKLYDNHFMQLAAYGQGLGYVNPLCAIVFVGRQEPWAVSVTMTREQRERGLAMFMALLTYWQAKTGHRPK